MYGDFMILILPKEFFVIFPVYVLNMTCRYESEKRISDFVRNIQNIRIYFSCFRLLTPNFILSRLNIRSCLNPYQKLTNLKNWQAFFISAYSCDRT